MKRHDHGLVHHSRKRKTFSLFRLYHGNTPTTERELRMHVSFLFLHIFCVVPSNGVPIAAELMMYAETGTSTGPSVHHRIIGPNHALPVKVRINGEGERVYLNAHDYDLVQEAKNICKASDVDCVDDVRRGFVFYKKDGTIWHWDMYAGFDMFQMSVNGQGVARPSSNPPTPTNPIKVSLTVTQMYEGKIANIDVTCRDFPTPCAVDASVPFTPSTPVPLFDFCSKDADGNTPCVYDPYNLEEKPDRSATCYGFLYERKRSEDATSFIPFTEEAKRKACNLDNGRQDQMVDYTNHNLNESDYDTTAFPQGTKLSFADACKLTCAEYNTPLITLSDARTLVLDMKGATSFTVKGSDIPKLRKLTLVNTDHLTSLRLDGVFLRDLIVPMTEALQLHTQGDSVVSYLKLTGSGSVSVDFINHIDGSAGVYTRKDIPTLPAGTPLLKGAVRYIDLSDTISIVGDVSALQLPQLWKLRARGITALDIGSLYQGCPKLSHLDVDISPVQIAGLASLGSFGVHFSPSHTFLSNGNTYPNRQIKIGPSSDLSAITNMLSGLDVTYFRADDITTGSGADLAALSSTIRSIRLSGAISGRIIQTRRALYCLDRTRCVKA